MHNLLEFKTPPPIQTKEEKKKGGGEQRRIIIIHLCFLFLIVFIVSFPISYCSSTSFFPLCWNGLDRTIGPRISSDGRAESNRVGASERSKEDGEHIWKMGGEKQNKKQKNSDVSI